MNGNQLNQEYERKWYNFYLVFWGIVWGLGLPLLLSQIYVFLVPNVISIFLSFVTGFIISAINTHRVLMNWKRKNHCCC